MPIRQAGMLARRASTWPRDHFCRNAIAPRLSSPTTWNEFLPISMPITAITLLRFPVIACSFRLAPPASLLADKGQEHGRTIPLTDMRRIVLHCDRTRKLQARPERFVTIIASLRPTDDSSSV